MQALQETFMETRCVGMHSRRALLQTPLYHHPSAADGGGPGSSFDANVVMILAVLLCALICALGFNSIIRCTLRCSSRLAAGAELGAAAAARPGCGGMRRKALRSMPVLVYSAGLRLHAASPVCAVCLSDFEPGEHVRVLPKCNHGFHVRCVDRWLLARSTCPTCRQPLFGAPPKASGCAEEGRAGPDPARPVLAPLRPEGVATLYDF